MVQNIEYTIKSFSGGVSTQRRELKLQNQVDEMNNMNILDDGSIVKRNGFEFVALKETDVDIDRNDNMLFFDFVTSNRDKVLMVLCKDGSGDYYMVQMERTTNTMKTTKLIDEYKDYLEIGSDIATLDKRISYITIGDQILLYNKEATVSKVAVVSSEDTGWQYGADKLNVFFLWVKIAYNDGNDDTNNGYKYRVNIDDNDKTFQYETTEEVASAIADWADSLDGFSSFSYGSIVRIEKDDDAEYTVKYGDNYGNLAMTGFSQQVDKPSDLPKQMRGFTDKQVPPIAISGVEKNKTGVYYLKWNGENWYETCKLCQKIRLDNTPISFRYEDGVLDQTLYKHDLRLTGDDDSNPIPSFDGKNIKNMFLYRDRVGIVAGDSVVLSRTSQYYNFFSKSAIDISDDDPIDLSIDTDDFNYIEQSTIYSGGVILWSSNGQFLLTDNGTMTPTTAQIVKTSSYKVTTDYEPISIDSDILFFQKASEYIKIFSFTSAQLQSDTTTAEQLNIHCSTYIPSNIKTVLEVKEFNQVFMVSEPQVIDGSTTTDVFVYKYVIFNGERVISAFYKWTVNGTISRLISDDIFLYIISDTNEDKLKFNVLKANLSNTSDVYKDYENIDIDSYIKISHTSPSSEANIRDMRNVFLLKTIKLEKDGTADIEFINKERGTTKVINNKFVSDRPLFIGSNSNNIDIIFRNKYEKALSLGSVYISGSLKRTNERIN